jgi:excinuclease ABC subunit C
MFDKEALLLIHSAPLEPGVYYFLNRRGLVIYVGKSKSLRKRLKSHLAHAQPGKAEFPKYAAMYEESAGLCYETCPSETEALVLECAMIKAYRPKHNSQMVADRSYPYIRVSTEDEYPSIAVAYDKGKTGAYYGSFYSESDAMSAISLLSDVLGTPKCEKSFAKAASPCLDYHLGSCIGPCAREIAPEDYREAVKKACALLSGKVEWAMRRAKKAMREAADALDYQTAALERDKAAALERLGKKARRLNTDVSSGRFALFFRAAREESFTAYRIEGGQVTAKRVYSAALPPREAEFREFLSQSPESYPPGLARLLLEAHADKYFVRLPKNGAKSAPASLAKKVREYLSLDGEKPEGEMP